MNPITKQKGINFGLILGFLLAMTTILGYAVNSGILVSYWTLLYVFLAVIITGIVAITSSRKALNNIINFKDAFVTFFIMLIIGLIISIATNFLIFNVVDPDFKEVVKEKQITAIEGQRDWFMEKMGNAPEEDIEKTEKGFDDAIAEIKEGDQYSIASLGKGFFQFTAFFSVFGLLLALFLRRKDPSLE